MKAFYRLEMLKEPTVYSLIIVYSESYQLEMIWKQDNINQITPSVTLTASEFLQYQYSAEAESLKGMYGSIFSH